MYHRAEVTAMRYDLHDSGCPEDFSPFCFTTRNRSLKSLSFLVRSTTALERDGACVQIRRWFCIMIANVFLARQTFRTCPVTRWIWCTTRKQYIYQLHSVPFAPGPGKTYLCQCTQTVEQPMTVLVMSLWWPALIEFSKIWDGSRQTTDQGTSVALAECTWTLANEAILQAWQQACGWSHDHNE